MKYAFPIVLLVAAMAVLGMSSAALAADQTHEGTVVSASNGKLVMTGTDSKEHSHNVEPTTKVMVNGKSGKLDDLKKGDKIKVTMKDNKVSEISTTRS